MPSFKAMLKRHGVRATAMAARLTKEWKHDGVFCGISTVANALFGFGEILRFNYANKNAPVALIAFVAMKMWNASHEIPHLSIHCSTFLLLLTSSTPATPIQSVWLCVDVSMPLLSFPRQQIILMLSEWVQCPLGAACGWTFLALLIKCEMSATLNRSFYQFVVGVAVTTPIFERRRKKKQFPPHVTLFGKQFDLISFLCKTSIYHCGRNEKW